MKLWQKVFLGLILGVIFGIYLKDYIEIIKPIGTIFLRLIKMIIVPLLFFTLVSGITGMRDPSSVGRIAKKSMFAYLGTTCFAVSFGLLIAHIIQPGVGVNIDLGPKVENNFNESSFDLLEFFIEVVPNNIFVSFAESNVLQVVFFSIFTGIMINSMGSSADPVRSIIHSGARIVLKMISVIVEMSPYAAFALTAWVIGTQGVEVIYTLGKLFEAIILAFALQYMIFGLIILVFCRMSPIPFYKKSIEYQMIALSTGSSKASLATTMQVCKQKLGVSEVSTSFVLPIGASINMNGLSIKLGLSTIFFAQVMGVDLSFADYIVIILTGTLGSIGGAGIPGSFIIMLPIMLSSVGLPIEGVALLVGIDRVLDLLSTTINITGDATITLVVDHSEGTLDKEMYYLESEDIGSR
ncbi:MAG TPA: dicarboxylate/amino acid:cation symporter [Candidatus Megaira endosymbiont of Nemacystus decipiens]|nr:dicarboxylate/amino acid:cation symporter [Candidatus Megaera endosymbiont of Nemacystus decipiens]